MGKYMVGKNTLELSYLNYGIPKECWVYDCYNKTQTKIGDILYTIEIMHSQGEDREDEDFQYIPLDMLISFGDGFLLVFAINDKNSFDLIPKKRENIIKRKKDEEFPIILVGNKQDLDNNREVSYDDAKKLADSWNIEYIETSTVTNFNCKEAFEHLAVKIYEYKKEKAKKSSSCPCSIY